MEVVKVLALQSAEQRPTLQMLTRTHSHAQYVCLCHLIDESLTDVCAICFFLLTFWLDVLVDEDTELPS